MPRLPEQQVPEAAAEYSDVSESDEYDDEEEQASALSNSGYGQGFGDWDEAVDIDSVRLRGSLHSNTHADDDLRAQNMRHGFAEAYSSEEYLQVCLALLDRKSVV